MKKQARALSLSLAMAILAAGLTACGPGSTTSSGTDPGSFVPNSEYMGYEQSKVESGIEDKDHYDREEIPEDQWITLSFLHVMDPDDSIDADNKYFRQLSKWTGIKFDFELVSPSVDDWTQKLVSRMASGNIPDLINCTQDSFTMYGPQGLLEPLDDLIESSENIQAHLTAGDIEMLKSTVDGHIYCAPQIRYINTVSMYGKTYRADILEELGDAVPTTNEEWLEVLKKVKSAEPDLIPYVDPSVEYLFWPQNLSSFDMGQLDQGNDDSFVGLIGSKFENEGDTTVQFLPITQEYKAMLEFYNRMYKEGLIAEEMNDGIGFDPWFNNYMVQGTMFMGTVSTPARAHEARLSAQELGITLDYEVAPPPINPATGKAVYYEAGNTITTTPHGIAISASLSEDKKEKAKNMLDILYSEDAILLYEFGILGEDYVIKDGMMQHKGGNVAASVDDYLKQNNGLAFYFNRVIYLNGEKSKYGLQLGMKEAENFYTDPDEYYVRLPVPIKNDDKIARYDELNMAMRDYVYGSMKGFIFGEKPFTDWDQYVAQLKSMGCDEVVQIMQTWVDNYAKFSE